MTATTRRPQQRRHLDPRSPYTVDVHELGRRPGAMRRLARVVPAPGQLGTEVIGVPEGSDVELALSLESVLDGVYVAGTAAAAATGECVRCLDPVTQQVTAEIQELYLYDPPEPGEDDGGEELPAVDGDLLDIEPALRDALVTALPFQPVCDEDCPGLCAECGTRLADAPGHTHETADPRWAALSAIRTAPPTDPAPAPAAAPEES